MIRQQPANLYKLITSVILYTFGLIILLWFLYQITNVLLLFLLAMVLGIIISNPVNRLEQKGMKRWLASLIILGTIFTVTTALFWLIVPHISEQIDTLIDNLPDYYKSLSDNTASLLKNYPELNKELQKGGVSISAMVPSVGKTVIGLSAFSISILGGIFVFIIFVCMVVFFVTNPKPLICLYLSVFKPEKRDKAEDALKHTAVMLGGWMKSNLIGGIIQAILVYLFLTFMNVPGALVWAALAFFSELLPKIGFYIMAIPPTLVALSISPATALWCLVFFLLLNEITADFLMPKLRASTMNIHPVCSLFLILAMGAAFGLTGVLLATPLAAIVKAYYEEFYLTQFQDDPDMENRVYRILYPERKKTK